MKTYIYPTYTPSRDKSGNEYIKYFHESFQKSSLFDQTNRLWKLGVASLFFNLDADLFVIQWVDLIPFKRLGKLQFLLFLIAIWLLHLFREKKILWILHNKHSHRGKSKLVDWGMRVLAQNSDCVIAHSSEGVSFFNENYPRSKGKCTYLPHPIYRSDIYESLNAKWDYVIWGGISRRKMVAEFLNFARDNQFFAGKKILICGNCSDKEYDSLIQKELWEDVTYINRFIKDDELRSLISQSKCILFTYNTDSLLSSGALIYSLNFCKPIIGPKSGNFFDLRDIVSCYDKFEDIPLLKAFDNRKAIIGYINENTWDRFPWKVYNIIGHY